MSSESGASAMMATSRRRGPAGLVPECAHASGHYTAIALHWQQKVALSLTRAGPR